MYMKGIVASSLPLAHKRHKGVAYNMTRVKLQTILFEVTTSVPLTCTSLPTLHVALVSCDTQGFGISPTSQDTLYKSKEITMTSSITVDLSNFSYRVKAVICRITMIIGGDQERATVTVRNSSVICKHIPYKET